MRVSTAVLATLALISLHAVAQTADQAASAASQASAALQSTGIAPSNILWILVAIAAIAVGLLILGLSQPSKATITYTADSFFQVRKLFFAAGVLGVLAFILVLSIATYVTLSVSKEGISVGKEIFDSMIKVVPPIMTLVLGYYFGQQSVVKDAGSGGNVPTPEPNPLDPNSEPNSGSPNPNPNPSPSPSPSPSPALNPSPDLGPHPNLDPVKT